MTIVGIARVPGITTVDLDTTHQFPATRDRIRGLVNRTAAPAVEESPVRIRTQDDVAALAAAMAPETETDRARLDAFGAAIVATPLADLAGRYDLSLTTAERVRALFGLADMAEQTAACR